MISKLWAELGLNMIPFKKGLEAAARESANWTKRIQSDWAQAFRQKTKPTNLFKDITRQAKEAAREIDRTTDDAADAAAERRKLAPTMAQSEFDQIRKAAEKLKVPLEDMLALWKKNTEEAQRFRNLVNEIEPPADKLTVLGSSWEGLKILLGDFTGFLGDIGKTIVEFVAPMNSTIRSLALFAAQRRAREGRRDAQARSLAETDALERERRGNLLEAMIEQGERRMRFGQSLEGSQPWQIRAGAGSEIGLFTGRAGIGAALGQQTQLQVLRNMQRLMEEANRIALFQWQLQRLQARQNAESP